MKISTLYGKRAVSATGKSGYVVAVNADGNRIAGVTCADGDERLFYVPAENITGIKSKVVFTDYGPMADAPKIKLGKPVFDCAGRYCGQLSDFEFERFCLVYAYVGRHRFLFDDLVIGDAAIIKDGVRILKSDVKKNGKVLIKRGTPLTQAVLTRAQACGEYIQASLKSI